MIREVIATGLDLDAAIEKGCSELGIERGDCSVEVLERVKKGLFGKIKSEAKVRVYVEEPDENEKLVLAKEYLGSICSADSGLKMRPECRGKGKCSADQPLTGRISAPSSGAGARRWTRSSI